MAKSDTVDTYGRVLETELIGNRLRAVNETVTQIGVPAGAEYFWHSKFFGVARNGCSDVLDVYH